MGQEQLEKKRPNFKNPWLIKEMIHLKRTEKFTGDKGEIFPLIFNGNLVLLAGLGKTDTLSLTELRILTRKAILSSYLAKLKDIELIPASQNDAAVIAVIEAVLIGMYAWKKYLSKNKDSKVIDEKNVWVVAPPKDIYRQAITVCEGVNTARNLINENADIATSAFIEKNIRAIVKGKSKASTTVLNKKELQRHGLNLHLAVNQGSRNEPKLIIVKYQGASAKEPFAAIVGKGITFDTGGLNLKPTGSIETMRTDMSGASAVIGTLKNVLALNLKTNILFVVGLAENVTGAGAYKPGDVIRGYSGKTVEIGNTDAEGRLVLADAIAYTVKNYKPKILIDLATLTGACVVALGHEYAGLMSNDDNLAEEILKSAEATDDRAWRLPIYPELKDHVKSLMADIKNVGLPRGAAGTISAAEFLRQFVGDTKWAHLDIAGTAFVDGPGRWYYGYGATGMGVRLLTHYLSNN